MSGRGSAAAAASGRPEAPELNVLVQHVVVAETPRRAAEQIAPRFRALSVDEALESPFLLLGPLDHLVETLRERRERWGLSYVVVFDRSVDDFAPVVARLAGG